MCPPVCNLLKNKTMFTVVISEPYLKIRCRFNLNITWRIEIVILLTILVKS